jgi:hypothetical protein
MGYAGIIIIVPTGSVNRFRFGNYRNRSVIYRTETETEVTDRSVSVR